MSFPDQFVTKSTFVRSCPAFVAPSYFDKFPFDTKTKAMKCHPNFDFDQQSASKDFNIA